jgi:hypothetical protein
VKIAPGVLEAVAQAVHEQYLREQVSDGARMGSTAALVPWKILNEDLREANRDQARDIDAKLSSIGCAITEADAGDKTFRFTIDELETLARWEHDRWSRQRLEAGWALGAVRDDAHKRHPSLVPWAQLSESEKDKDRDAVRNIPAVLRSVGLGVARRMIY